ncbi:hypothetical protein [Vreelandella neptunia]|uniref:Uncharacterized protein n=1 Tax=Vreelandella neptunia TaxID=115551 RepID=A0ABZ0YGZ3_9GAMM|nr:MULTISPECIES: hypothetical protein [Halomonas]MBL1267872.1 hypothetical protein [Halomonas sp.]MDN3561395.1 hypothetical protein [Halomonas neptunia]TDV93611.1 hypothetical protein BDK62_11427 [Halomonas alkaliantarctica]WQH10998.1 hypothetical protein SR894_12575 [Halomonas neptunia]
MLFANSTPLLWLSYYGLSLLVVVAVYFALTFLPRLPRLVLTWMVAGAIWAPATFRLPLIEEGEFYTGWAPSAMVAAVGFLENNGAALRGGLMWLVLGMTLGALIGVALWWWRRPGDDEYVVQEEERADESESPRRREPVIG